MTKKILKFVQNRHKSQLRRDPKDLPEGEGSVLDKTGDLAPQIILTAATMPSGGPQTVGKQLLRLFPRNSVMVVRTESAHKTLPRAKLEFVRCSDVPGKFRQLLSDLDALLSVSNKENASNQLPKILIFVNTRESAETVSRFFSELSTALSDATTTSSGAEAVQKWWEGRVGCFFKQPGVPNEEREMVLRHFREGSVRVLICSDLGSRGLDFPDCDAVIQFDFPENSEFFLHRAGRTARAGRSGRGMKYFSSCGLSLAVKSQLVIQQ